MINLKIIYTDRYKLFWLLGISFFQKKQYSIQIILLIKKEIKWKNECVVDKKKAISAATEMAGLKKCYR